MQKANQDDFLKREIIQIEANDGEYLLKIRSHDFIIEWGNFDSFENKGQKLKTLCKYLETLDEKPDFTKINFLQHKPDCFFFNNPFRDEKKCVIFINKIISKLPAKRKITFIFCNFDQSILLKIYKLKRIKHFYMTQNKGFSIFQLN